MDTSRSCLSIDELAHYAAGRDLTGGRHELDRHIDACERCQAEVIATVRARRGAVGTDPTVVDGDRPTALGSTRMPAVAPLPETIGKFELVRRLGAGAMGVVYLASDPDLHRKVALKVVQQSLTGEQARARMLREAQAMAQLDHPNVVRVYEVGEDDGGDVYIAMEFVDGTTLTDWLRAEPRPWRHVVSAFQQAARGLAAAHDVGLVHRDFKPDNVLVDRAGNVKVSDFGLARAVGAVADAPSGSPAIATLFTHEGALVGTPVYMSPEQLDGEPATAKSDQFAWCVALYEAIYGARPFTGATLALLVLAVADGAKQPPGPRSPLWPVLERGLAVDPAARFDDLHALMRDVARALTARRRTIAFGVGAVAAIGAAAALALLMPKSDPLADQASAVWNPERATSLAAQLQHSSKRPAAHVAEQAARATKQLDDFAATWLADRRSVEPEPEPGVRRCFDREIGAVDQWLSLASTSSNVDDIVSTLEWLPDPARCLDANLAAPPSDRAAALAATVDALALRAMHGDVTGLAQRLDPLMPEIRALGWPWLIADALAVEATISSVIRDAKTQLGQLQEAIAIAPGGNDRLRIRLLAGLVELTAKLTPDFTAAKHWVDEVDREVARARAAKVPAPVLGQIESLGLSLHAELSAATGDHAGALATRLQALDVTRRAVGEQSTLYAEAEKDVADTLLSLGRVDEATPHFERAIAILQQALGPTHPRVASVLDGLANARLAAADFTGARAKFSDVLAIETAAYGADDIHTVLAREGLANLDMVRGDLTLALSEITKAIDITRAIDGDSTKGYCDELAMRGAIQTMLGDGIAAHRDLDAALALGERLLGKDNPRLDATVLAHGILEFATADYAAARRDFERDAGFGGDTTAAEMYLGSLDLAEGKLEDARVRFHRLRASMADHSDETTAVGALAEGEEGRALAGLHRWNEAFPLLEQAEAAARKFGASGANMAGLRAALSHAEVIVKHDKVRALELARLAREDFMQGAKDPDSRAVRAEITPWLASLGVTL